MRFIGLSFSPASLLRKQNNSIKGLSLAPLAMFFTSPMMNQNTAPLNEKDRPPVWAKIYPVVEALQPAEKYALPGTGA